MRGKVVARVDLGAPAPGEFWRGQGVVVADDATLRVCCDGALHAVTCDGRVLWCVPLLEGQRVTEWHSAPTALVGGRTLVTLSRSLLVVTATGQVEFQLKCPGPCDDSGPSPALTLQGEPLVTSQDGSVWRLHDGHWRELGDFGLDILPPALFPDGSLAISGYYGEGLCRIDLDGAFVFQTSFKEADLLPTVSRAGVVAAGSINDRESRFFDSEGNMLGRYGREAVFADHDDGWVALARGSISLLTSCGDERWSIGSETSSIEWGLRQPLIDGQGRIYVPYDTGVAALERDGSVLFAADLGGAVRAIAPVVQGVLACTTGHALVLIS